MVDQVSDVFEAAANADTSEDIFTPFTIRGTGSDFSDKVVASQLSAVQSFVTARTVGLQTYDKAKNDVINSANIQALVDLELTKYGQVQTQTIMQAADPQTTTEAAEQIQQNQDDLSQPDALQRGYIQAISRADTNVEKSEIANQYFMFKMQEIMSTENNTLLETIANYGGMFIPDTPWDVADITGGSAITFIGDWTKILEGFRSLEPAEKVKLAGPILEGLLEGFDGNQLKAVSAAMDFISPKGGSDITLQGILDAFDIATLGAGTILAVISKPIRAIGLVKAAKRVKNEKLAGEVNAAAMVDPKAAEAAGVDLHTAQMNTSGYAMEKLLPDMTDGVAGETVLALESRLNKVRKELDDIDFQGTSVATASERIAGKKAFFDNWEERIANIEAQRNITVTSKPRFKGDTPEGFDVEVTLSNGDTEVVPITFTKNDLGAFDGLAKTPSLFALSSPSVYLKNVGSNLVNTATRLGFQEARNIKGASQAYQAATKGLNKKALEKIDDVLLHGDAKGIRYTTQDLMYEGIQTANGVQRFSAAEADSYQSMRAMFDWLHMQKNDQLRRQLEFEGFGYLPIKPSSGIADVEGVFAKTIADDTITIKQVFDFDTNGVIDRGTDLYNQKLASGEYELVRFRSAIKINKVDGTNEFIQTGLVKSGSREGLPAQVLNYHPGYVPIIYKDVYFVARSKQTNIIDGVELKAPLFRTEGFFDNLADANKWKVAQEDPDKFVITKDRELPGVEKGDADILQFGTLFGSARSKRTLFQGVNESPAQRANAFEALERNLAHVVHASTMNEFRVGVIEKFKRTAGQYLTENNWQSAVRSTVPVNIKRQIERTRTWIQEQLRVPTEAERAFEGRMNAIADSITDTWLGESHIPFTENKNLRKMFMDVGATDPWAALRSASFHTLLGAWNPAQILVQAQNASFAFSLAPLRAPMLIRQYLGLRTAMLTPRNPKAIALAARGAGIPEKEFAQLVDDFDKTGLFQSVKTNADFAASLDGFRIDGGALKRAVDTNLIFFREGEIFGRGYAWLLARDDFIKANPKRALDKIAISEITDKSLAFTMNLNRANRANWQKGFLSLPTQYKQVTTKYLETVFGLNNALTRPERAKVVVGQLALYGTAGIGIGGSWLASSLLNSTGIDFNDLTQEEQAFARGGAWELAFEMAFDVRVESGRFAVAAGIEEFLREFHDDDATLIDMLSGAFGTIPHRGWQALDAFSTVFADPKEFNFTQGEMIEALSIVGDIFSSWRNVHQAYTWSKLQMAIDSKGRKLFDIPEGDYTHIITKGLGFQPARIQDIYTAKEFNRTNQDDITNVVNGLTIAYRKYLSDSISSGTYKAARIAILESLPTQEMRDKAKKAFGKRVFDKDSVEEKAFKKALNNYLESGSFSGSPIKKDSVGLTEQFGKKREE